MLTPNHGCVGVAGKFTCSDTVFASLVIFYIYDDNRTNISFINSLMT